MTGAGPGQLDLLALLELAALGSLPPTLFGSPTRGLPPRLAEYERWHLQYGGPGSLAQAYAWTVAITCPDTPTERCQATVLSVDLRCHGHYWRERSRCSCVGELLYRGACRRCDWEGQPHVDENAAAEDACTHAWPGWRDLPVVPEVPQERKRRARWVEHVTARYPAGWLEDGGPIRTGRTRPGNRHVPDRTPFGGYDLAVPDRPASG